MFTILNNTTPVVDCDDLQTAVRFVQSLESGLDRHASHSPYTIVRTDTVIANHDRPHVGASDFQPSC